MDFTRHHPGMRLQLNLANPEHAGRVFDAADLTLCVGEPPVSSRVAHHLGFVSGGLYAAEAYLAARGEPAHPSDLREQDCIGFRLRADGLAARWPLACGDERVEVQPASRFSVNEAGMARGWRRWAPAWPRWAATRSPMCARACCAGSCRNGAWRRCPSMR